jgi:UDP-glucose 4-epimerase
VPKSIKYNTDFTLFSITESAASDFVEYYSKMLGIEGLIYRLPPVYGYGPHLEGYKDGEPYKTGFMIFVQNAIKGAPIEIWGDYNRGRDIIYVKDVVSAIIKGLFAKNAAGLYNISSGKSVTLKEEVEEIIRIFSSPGKPSRMIFRPDKPNSIESFRYDISKARRQIGWSPKYSLADMLIDFKKELKSGRFRHLLEKRERMLNSEI